MTPRRLDKITSTDDSHPETCRHLDELLVHALVDTDYRFGQLNFLERGDQTELGSFVEYADNLPHGWTTYRQTDMVLHPARGALLLRDCRFRPHEPAVLLADRLERIHGDLVELQQRIRRRLDEHSYWKGRPIVLGIGIVVRGQSPDAYIPSHIPGELVVDQPPPRDFEPQLERLFDYYTTPATTPVDDYAPRLVADLTDSPTWLGNFIDETALADMIDGRNNDESSPSKAA